ncbi:hypothetical protein V2J09_024304 [Rumex salicifolius]
MEVVGRHALFFDDDASANFVNSKEALVEWNSLFIDRYDVRHLLSSPPASFKRIHRTSGSSPIPDPHLDSELDVERYADLPSPRSSDQEPSELEADTGTLNAGGYHAVTFSYGNNADTAEQKNDDINSEVDGFCPPFSVPDHLAYSLPSSEKLHHIIARTALFVSQHGGQSEIVLRVKQGDNPTFGFLMPHHHLHPYFRYLVDHPEILNASSDGNSQKDINTDNQSGSPGTEGALSLLGSVYGSAEDEDVVPEDAKEFASSSDMDSVETTAVGDLTIQHQSKKQDVLDSVSQKHQKSSKLIRPSKEKASLLINSGVSSCDKLISANNGKEDTVGADVKSSKLSVRSSTLNDDLLVIEPPSELKRLVDRIVEIILKNGQGFEALLIEQDKNHGRFPFLLSSNQHHPYYKKMLRMAQKSRAVAKSFGSGKDAERETGQSKQSEESAVQDLPSDSDRKEKFKMVINKIKKEIQEQPSKEPQQPPVEISVNAAAAILQAATRGIKPNLDFFSKNLSSGSSQAQSCLQKKTGIEHPTAPVSVAKEIAKTAAMVAAGEADSSEAGLTREQKLKAERLKRAKMFAAMMKGGVTQPLGKDHPRGLSAEPPRSNLSGSGVDFGTQGAKDREGSSVPSDLGTSHKIKNSGKFLDNEMDDDKSLMSKRHYRSKNLEDVEDLRKEESDEENDRHSRKKRRSHHSSCHHRDTSKERHKHRRRHSKDRHRHDKGSQDEDKHHHHHKHDSSSEDEYERYKHKRRSSQKGSDDRRKKHKKRSSPEEREFEEGEIRAKSSDQSLSNVVDAANKNTSLDRLNTQQEERMPSEPPQTTVVSDDLRAKIRAMLLATM